MHMSIIDQGINLMLYGMGTVFVFLTLLVFATWLMSKLVQMAGIEDSPVETKTQPLPAVDSKTLSILQAAINKHLNKD